MEHILNISTYFQKGYFVVPSYQRGYKWSLLKNDSGKTHLVQMLQDLKNAQSKKTDYHLQGVTVKETGGAIELVDGQQRSTSLYLILLFAHHHNLTDLAELLFTKDGLPRLEYQVRKELKDWLMAKLHRDEVELCAPPNLNHEIQDIAAFNRAWKQIDETLHRDDLPRFIDFVRNHVKVIYVVLSAGISPTKVFSMMNKDKAPMSKCDLVKAKLLSEASRANTDSTEAEADDREWQINQVRSHYAHEWDRWREWWENNDHHCFFGKALSKPANEPQIALLLRFYLRFKCVSEDDANGETLYTSLERLIQDKSTEIFEDIRDMQEIFQEWYNDPEIFNALGLLFYAGHPSKTGKLLLQLYLRYYQTKEDFGTHAMETARWSLVGCERKDEEGARKGAKNVCGGLMGINVYESEFKEDAFRQLLRMNIERLPRTERFYFADYSSSRSLDHIQPKSKVVRRLNKGWLSDDEYAQEVAFTRDEVSDLISKGYLDLSDESYFNMDISEHCIGNLVLLNRSDNSAVGTNGLKHKREILFKRIKEGNLLIHTLMILTKSYGGTNSIRMADLAVSQSFEDRWQQEDMMAYKKDFEQNFKKCYSLENDTVFL
jgi:hypothetical protein